MSIKLEDVLSVSLLSYIAVHTAHTGCVVNLRRPLIDVARFHGLGNGNGYIHYQASADNVFCHTCCKVLITKKVAVSTGN